MLNQHYSKYLSYLLNLKVSNSSIERFGRSVINSTIELTPHQIDAALFTFQNPLSKGAILADEVGLGKTIEAGLVISQFWASSKRKILCIMPASIRKQWETELLEKFFIKSEILDSKIYKDKIKANTINPFAANDKIIICSYEFAKKMESDISKIDWDLIVIDEAHHLRNVYRSDNKIAKTILKATKGKKKLLLTATPLQNSLLELYGLVSFIDDRIFGDINSFKSQFVRPTQLMDDFIFKSIRERITPISHRTLRKQVREYIKYTTRQSISINFTPSDDELKLYEGVSDYLRSNSYGLPGGQKHLLTLVVRKILASSSFAIAETLNKIIARLEQLKNKKMPQTYPIDLSDDFEELSDMAEEWENLGPDKDKEQPSARDNGEIFKQEISEEIKELKYYKTLAQEITQNAKGEALIDAIQKAFKKADELKSPHKILIFTESKRTQEYVKQLLNEKGYGGTIVTLNGTNTDPASQNIYQNWKNNNVGTGKITGIKSADIRTSIIDEFKTKAKIMIATESGAEGLNLQFCNIIINYDLPWNPQRIEQRIGRCHRYGQKYDVVVINFFNTKNAADQRVLQLLQEKLKLFDGVFGSSDTVLGALESGVDIERAINDIFQKCRTEEDINKSFDDLQAALDSQIKDNMAKVKAKIFDNFDSDVLRRIRGINEKVDNLTEYERSLLKLLEIELEGFISVEKDLITIKTPSFPGWNNDWSGKYSLKRVESDIRNLNYNHPMVQLVLKKSFERELPNKEVTFDYSNCGETISMVKNLLNKTGYISLDILSVDAGAVTEHLIFSGITETGRQLTSEECKKILQVKCLKEKETTITKETLETLSKIYEEQKQEIIAQINTDNKNYLEQEVDKLDNWANDLKNNLEENIKTLDKEISSLSREAYKTDNLEGKLKILEEKKKKEDLRSAKRKNLFDEQDHISERKEKLFENAARHLKQKVEIKNLFLIKWDVT